MIPFLVKLANLLDDRGQHSIAREVDDLVVKLAQIRSPEELIKRYQDSERANLDAAQRWQEAQKAWQARPSDDLLAARDEAKKHYDSTWAARDQAKAELDADSQQGLARLHPTPAPSKEIAKKPQKKSLPNPLVVQIQHNLGVEPTGHWNPKTNRAFIAAMNSHPEYAKMMVSGKFSGTLEEAAKMTTQLASLKDMNEEPGMASKEPSAPAPAQAPVKQEDDKEVPNTSGGHFGGPGRY